MNKKYLFFIGALVVVIIMTYTTIKLVQSHRMDEDINAYLDTHFLRRHDEDFFKASHSPYFLYAGYQSNTNIETLVIYHYEENDFSICPTVLIDHDGYIDKDYYLLDYGECKDYVIIGNTGISYVIVKLDKGSTIDYRVENDTVRVETISYFDNNDYIVFYSYGTLNDNKSVIIEGETVDLNG